MSNYSQTTNFTAKDSLISGDPAKLVLGGEFDSEFGAIQIAVNSKADFISGIAVNLTAAALTVNTSLTISDGTVTDFGTIDGGTY